MKQMMLMILPLLVLVSCKKSYTCACGDLNSTERTPVWEVRDTRKNAVDKCASHPAETGYISNFTCEIQ